MGSRDVTSHTCYNTDVWLISPYGATHDPSDTSPDGSTSLLFLFYYLPPTLFFYKISPKSINRPVMVMSACPALPLWRHNSNSYQRLSVIFSGPLFAIAFRTNKRIFHFFFFINLNDRDVICAVVFDHSCLDKAIDCGLHAGKEVINVSLPFVLGNPRDSDMSRVDGLWWDALLMAKPEDFFFEFFLCFV